MITVNVGNNMGRSDIVIDENTTLRDALEMKDIDYSRGNTMLDGSTIPAGGLNKTFADYGVTPGSKCILFNVVKADNAATVKVVGSVASVVSAAKLDDIKKVAASRPNALQLFEGEGANRKPVFAVGIGKGDGSICGLGVSFGEATNAEGKAVVTMHIPAGTQNVKEYVAKQIGTAIIKLGKVEAGIPAAMEEVAAEEAAVLGTIEVL